MKIPRPPPIPKKKPPPKKQLPRPPPRRRPRPPPPPAPAPAPAEEHILAVGDQEYIYKHSYVTELAGDTYHVYYTALSGNLSVAVRADARRSSWLSWAWCPHDDMMIHSEMAFALPCDDACPTGARFEARVAPNVRYSWRSFTPATMAFTQGEAYWLPGTQEMILKFNLPWPVPGSSTAFVRFGAGPVIAGVPSAHLVTPRLGTLREDGTMTIP